MNIIYDTLVLGGSKEGKAVASQLKKSYPMLNVGIVSEKVISLKSSYVDIFQHKAVFSGFNHGLISITLETKQLLFCKNLVVATGGRPKTLPFAGLTYNIDKVVPNKQGKLIICGQAESAAKAAVKLAKKFKYIYLCQESLKPDLSESTATKLASHKNIAILPGCKIISSKMDKSKSMVEVKLDTYDSIKCNCALFLSGQREPDVNGLSKQMISINEFGYIETDDSGSTLIIKNIYAVGECSDNYIKPSAIVNALAKANKWTEEK